MGAISGNGAEYPMCRSWAWATQRAAALLRPLVRVRVWSWRVPAPGDGHGSRAVCAVRWPQAGAVQLYWKTIRVIDLMWLRSCAPPPRHGYRYCDLVQLRVYELYRITACLYESPSPGPPQLPAVPSGAASRSAAFSERRPRLDIAPSNWRGTRSARPTQRSAAS
jgi:hypothetical protein